MKKITKFGSLLFYVWTLQQGIESGPLFPAALSRGSSNNSTPDRRNSPAPVRRLSPAPSRSKNQSPALSGSNENQPSPGPSTSAVVEGNEEESEAGPNADAEEEEWVERFLIKITRPLHQITHRLYFIRYPFSLFCVWFGNYLHGNKYMGIHCCEFQ